MLTIDDYYRLWVELHASGDCRHMNGEEIKGAFFLLTPPSIGPQEWMMLQAAIQTAQNQAVEDKIATDNLNGIAGLPRGSVQYRDKDGNVLKKTEQTKAEQTQA